MDNYRPKLEQRFVHQLSQVTLLLMLTLVQTALLPSLWHFRINLVLLAVIGWTLLSGLVAGVRWSIYGGLALGVLSPLPFGAHLFGLVLVAAIIELATEAFPRDDLFVITLAMIGGSFVQGIILALAMRLTGRPISWPLYPFTVLLPEAILNTLAAGPIYFALRWLRRRERRYGWV